eukprot:4415430-Prymnesium_polylepis.1
MRAQADKRWLCRAVVEHAEDRTIGERAQPHDDRLPRRVIAIDKLLEVARELHGVGARADGDLPRHTARERHAEQVRLLRVAAVANKEDTAALLVHKFGGRAVHNPLAGCEGALERAGRTVQLEVAEARGLRRPEEVTRLERHEHVAEVDPGLRRGVLQQHRGAAGRGVDEVKPQCLLLAVESLHEQLVRVLPLHTRQVELAAGHALEEVDPHHGGRLPRWLRRDWQHAKAHHRVRRPGERVCEQEIERVTFAKRRREIERQFLQRCSSLAAGSSTECGIV